MGSVTEERHKQAAQACRLLQRIPIEAQAHGWTPEERSYRSRETVKKIEELCASEIIRAILRNWIEAGLCGVYIGVVQNPPYTTLRILHEDPEIIYAGIREAAGSVAVSGVQFHEHVEACVAKNILEKSTELANELRRLKPRALLKVCDAATLERTRFIVEYLGEEQRMALSNLLFHKLGGKPRPLRMDKVPKMPEHPTPKQKRAWLHWYIWYLRMHEPEVQRVLGGVPRVVVVADGDRMLTNKTTGQPADPLGPIHAPVWRALGRELNKHGHPIKDPESENKIAKSIGVSRDKLRSYPRLPIKITPDGKSGVNYQGTLDDLLQAIEASLRKKPTKHESSS